MLGCFLYYFYESIGTSVAVIFVVSTLWLFVVLYNPYPDSAENIYHNPACAALFGAFYKAEKIPVQFVDASNAWWQQLVEKHYSDTDSEEARCRALDELIVAALEELRAQ
jgi:hypothetical protein